MHRPARQGLVLDVSPLEWSPLDEFPAAEQVMAAAAAAGLAQGRRAPPPVWLALDEVVDPVSGWLVLSWLLVDWLVG